MQTYTRITNEFTGVELPGKIDENLQSLKSDFSGTAFPTSNLVEGMTCFRTDQKKVYRLMSDLNTWKLESDLNYDGGVTVATQAQAEEGTDNTVVMTPLRVKQSVQKNAPAPAVMTGASASAGGKSGLVPQPSAGDNNKVLHGDGLWKKAIGFESYWEASEKVSVGDIRFPYGRENSGYILECVEAGTTGTTQPEIISDENEIANYGDLGVVGRMRMIFNMAEKDVDEVLAMGVTYSRLTYPELWEWAGKRAGLMISEAEWQAKFAETNGKFVPYYSSGDGSSTFRTPLLGAYLKGAETAGDVGEYKEAGLPNIGGQENLSIGDGYGALLKYPSGAENSALYAVKSEGINHYYDPAEYNNNLAHTNILGMDASRCSSVYGNSDTVTPDTMVGIWVIKAVGVVVDSGNTDIAQCLTATEQVQERVSAVEDWTQDSANFSSMPARGVVDVNIANFSNIGDVYNPPTRGYFAVYISSDVNTSPDGIFGIEVEGVCNSLVRMPGASIAAQWASILVPCSPNTPIRLIYKNNCRLESAQFCLIESEV